MDRKILKLILVDRQTTVWCEQSRVLSNLCPLLVMLLAFLFLNSNFVIIVMETKVCTVCKMEKDISNFAYRDKSKNKFQSNCKACQKEYDKNHYLSDSRKKSIRLASKKYCNKSKDFVNEYKKSHKCIICGEDRWYVLEFHHKLEKSFNLGDAAKNGISVNKLKREIDKCDVLCANCHRELHHKEKQ